MKRWMTTLLGVLLVAAMMISFAACTGDNKEDDDKGSTTTTVADGGTAATTAGGDTATTVTTVPATEDRNSIVGAWKGGMDVGEFFAALAGVDVGEAEIVMLYTFNEDGTYAMSLDAEKTAENMEGLLETLAQLEGMTVEEYCEQSGMTKDEMLADMTAGFADGETEGTYKVDGTTLIVDEGELAEASYQMTFNDDGSLTLEMLGVKIELTKA